MALSHTIYYIFGSLEFAQDYITKNTTQVTTQVTFFDDVLMADARTLKVTLQEYVADNVIRVLRIEKIRPEVQNVLLKVCEEMTHSTIVFSFPSSVQLIDTLLSRGVTIQQTLHSFHFSEENAKLFYDGTFAQRVTLFETLVKKNSEIDSKTIITHLVDDCLVLSRLQKDTENPLLISHTQQNAKIYIEVLEFLSHQKISTKQVFEYMALMIKK